jgi:hypothetical protein
MQRKYPILPALSHTTDERGVCIEIFDLLKKTSIRHQEGVPPTVHAVCRRENNTGNK